MTTLKKKMERILSSGSDSDDVDQGNPKTHENGKNGGKRRNLGDNKVDDTEHLLKSKTCFVCDGKDDWVLVCHGEECPLTIHQGCASDEPDFDEFGNFYCHYCWYKRVFLKSMKLQKKLMLTEKFRKGRETLGVDMSFMMDDVAEDVDNVVEVDVLGGRKMTNVNPSGNRWQGGESYEKFIVMEKNQRIEEIAAESDSQEVSKSGYDDVDEGTAQREIFSEKNCEASDACTSNAVERNKGIARFSGKNNEKVQVCNSDVGEERKQRRRCDINHEIAHVPSFDKTRKQRIYSEKSQRIKRVARTRKRGAFIIYEETKDGDSDLGEGRSGQRFFDENNQRKKTSSTESCAQEVLMTDKRVSHGSELREGRYRNGRHIENETETQEKKVSKDGQRKRKGAVERDEDEFYFVENQDRQYRNDMRNDDVVFIEQGNGFSKDEQVERDSVSSSISSPLCTDNVKDSNAASQELALIIHPMAGLQERPIQGRPIEARPIEARPIEARTCRSVSSKKLSNDPGQRNFVLCGGSKRKRLFWTPAEEEMLRVGVQKFPGFRNIPWRKILEYGQDVFQEERLPSDLKDKWKTMKKMSFDTGKWVSLSTERQPNYSKPE